MMTFSSTSSSRSTLSDRLQLLSYPRAEPVVKPHWRLHRESLKEKFPEGWNPPRRLSRGEMNTIRRLHALDPIQFSTPKLADQFKISVEAVRRILKSKFRTEEEIEEEKIGDALLQEADLGTYDKSQGLPPRSSRLLPDYEEDKPKYADRKTKPAKPIQEGFHASKLSSEYKWAAGQRSNLVNPSPMFRTRKWEGSGRSRFDRTLRPTGDTSEEGEEESRATFRRQEQAS